jgi:hypothetical protein
VLAVRDVREGQALLHAVGSAGRERRDLGLASRAQLTGGVDGREVLEPAFDGAVSRTRAGLADPEPLGDLLVPERLSSPAEVLDSQDTPLAFAERRGELADEQPLFCPLGGKGGIVGGRGICERVVADSLPPASDGVVTTVQDALDAYLASRPEHALDVARVLQRLVVVHHRVGDRVVDDELAIRVAESAGAGDLARQPGDQLVAARRERLRSRIGLQRGRGHVISLPAALDTIVPAWST